MPAASFGWMPPPWTIAHTCSHRSEATLYEWDYRNRLTTISSYDCDPEAFGNAVLQKTVTQTYDVWNQWVRRQVDSGSPLIADTYFIYDAGQLVMSFDALCGSNATEGRISRGTRYLWGPAVDQLLAEEGVKYQGSEGTLWQLTDNLGSVRDLAEYDEATGTTSVVNHITYDSFGNVTNETAAVDHLFGYTGRAYDEETGLQNNLNRWYDAASGKWLSEDPIGFAGGDANLSRYVGNSATNATDPSGLEWVWPWDKNANLNVRDNLNFWTGGFLPDQAEYDAMQNGFAIGVSPNPAMIYEGISNRLRAMGHGETVERCEIALYGPVADPSNYTANGEYTGPRYGTLPSPIRIFKLKKAPTGANTWTKASSEYIRETRKAFDKSGGAKQKFWENQYATNKCAYSPQDQALIKRGNAPFGTDGKPMVLHHRTPIQYGGTNDFSNLQPMRYTDHSLKPNFGPLHTPPFPD